MNKLLRYLYHCYNIHELGNGSFVPTAALYVTATCGNIVLFVYSFFSKTEQPRFKLFAVFLAAFVVLFSVLSFYFTRLFKYYAVEDKNTYNTIPKWKTRLAYAATLIFVFPYTFLTPVLILSQQMPWNK